MRRFCLGACTLAIVLTLTGCRQPIGTTSGSPLTPIGPLAPVGLAPIGTPSASASSAMGAFSAPTRVPPPPANSTNTQAGGFVPYGQTFSSGAPTNARADSFANSPSTYAQPSSDLRDIGTQPIGSGVATVGWAETTTDLPSSSVAHPQPAAGPTRPQLRFNGMQVNDLTGASSQPYIYNAPAVAPAVASAPNGSSLSQGYYPPTVDLRGSPMTTPIVTSGVPVGTGSPQPYVAPMPSTEPVGQLGGVPSSDALPWRRPGTAF
ncbi:hypothetical protein CA13_24530 [Planctomycetes bacterium CA13]|uniref:Uncharacterized protein n=1 Tax=Novipirellula herctigrandis TaxID=2527986 RepID=A0A5C5Z1W7_9BACT|nr:hypothetical protein CA13_24530 [Planctomycetes bacterium CA13]